MKAADLETATRLVKRLGEIKAERAALAGPFISGGVRVNGSAQWVNAIKPETRERIARLLLDERDAEEARLRRSAAQISLSLQD